MTVKPPAQDTEAETLAAVLLLSGANGGKELSRSKVYADPASQVKNHPDGQALNGPISKKKVAWVFTI